MSDKYFTKSHTSTQSNSTAKSLSSAVRQQIGVSALAGKDTISNLSRQHSTSRKFVYSQKDKVSAALDEAFSTQENDSEVLFTIPVTKQWLKQVVLSLILICHSSYGGVIEFFRDIFGQHICKGTIFNIIQNAVSKARGINKSQDLSSIKVGAHDEIFQGKTPVLVGCDIESTFTYLLKQDEHRDATTWGVRLLELNDQGMKLDHTITDGGKGLRSGQREAWPDVPCRGDVFHPMYDMGKLVTFLENRAIATAQAVEVLEVKIAKAKKKKQGTKYSKRLGHAREEMEVAIRLKNDISTLFNWLKNDILSVVGADFTARRELLNFVVDELQARESLSPHRIRPVRRLLEVQGEDLIRFVEVVDAELQDLANLHEIDLYWVRQVFELQSISTQKNLYWERAAVLYHEMGSQFYTVEKAVQELINNTTRASSIVENLNSRLRNYFFLRKTLGNGYLELLQFFLNHRRFMRSNRSERVDKSPKELLTGNPHDHWLELLGYSLFKKSDNMDKSITEEKQVA